MFFLLSKILYFLILPFSWVVILLVGSWFPRDPLLRRKLRTGGILLLLVFSLPYPADWALAWLEAAPEKTPFAETAIILTGTLQHGITGQGQPQFSEATERFTEATRLYHEGRIQKILISGGAASLEFPDENEGESIRDYLVRSLNVPAGAIQVENRSRNTHENAVECAKILSKRQEPVILITSAFHMPRAVQCFEKQQVSIIPYPVDFRARTSFSWQALVPSSRAFDTWATVVKECVGLAMYRAMGYT